MQPDAPRIAPDDTLWWLEEAEPAAAWLREKAPVFEYQPGVRTVARYDDVRTVSRDPATFCSSKGVLVLDPLRSGHTSSPVDAPSVLFMDPPEHAQFRKLVSRAFTPRATAMMETAVRDRTLRILDEVPGPDIDLVEHIAVRLPLQMIAALLGLDDVAETTFRFWSDETIKAADGLRADLSVVGEFVAFMMDGIAAHRAEPRDDILQLLVDAELDGRSLTDPELLVFCMSLLVAGNETTRNLISGGAVALAQHPDQRDWLAANPAGIDHAVEEMLRWVTPIKAFARTATRDTTLAGSPIGEGDYLVMLYGSANRDERAFGPTADHFDVRRRADPAHLAFGFGEHLCLGASLARLEARVVFEELLRRAPRFELAGTPVRLHSTLVNGWETVPVHLRTPQ